MPASMRKGCCSTGRIGAPELRLPYTGKVGVVKANGEARVGACTGLVMTISSVWPVAVGAMDGRSDEWPAMSRTSQQRAPRRPR